MTASQFDAEREVDLARWRRAVVALWWLPVAGLVIGAVAGVLYSFRGGTNYKATALRGHVSIGTIGSAGAGAARTQPIISLTVTGAHGKNVALAANKLADIVVEQTTASYVEEKIKTFNATLKNVTGQLK